jgi:hypothetical protein
MERKSWWEGNVSLAIIGKTKPGKMRWLWRENSLIQPTFSLKMENLTIETDMSPG